MYSFENSDYTFFSIYQKMYNIAVIYLQFIWFGNAFSLVRSINHAPEARNYTFFLHDEKMYNRAW